MIVPAALTQEEKDLKAYFERLKNDRKNLESALKKNIAGKIDQRQSKESVDDAEFNREELIKKLATGKVILQKTEEKQAFKRNKIAKKESSTIPYDYGKLEPQSSRIAPHQHFQESNRGPAIYIRGYNLREISLNSSFSKFGQITRCHVEERQRSAFVTFSSVDEAESAIKEMNGQLIDGISVQVSFARRQNQDNSTQRWQQPFVSAGFSEATPERHTIKRKLTDQEDGELFDNDIE